jgi:hypothetical protein
VRYLHRHLTDKRIRENARGTWLHLRSVEVDCINGAGWRLRARVIASDGECEAGAPSAKGNVGAFSPTFFVLFFLVCLLPFAFFKNHSAQRN